MTPFTYVRAKTVEDAVRERHDEPESAYLAGGTSLIDLLKLGVRQPTRLIDIRFLGLNAISQEPDGRIRIGAGATNSAVAYDERVARRYPALAQALLAGANPQIRNVATVGGNLLQAARCVYYRDATSDCNRRVPGSGCAAAGGWTRTHSVIGAGDQCIAVHPSDMAVALTALDALVDVHGLKGRRTLPIEDLYPPNAGPLRDSTLEADELIVGIELPDMGWFARSVFVKARDRAAFEFALASAAVALNIEEGKIRDCRIALGGVAPKPWRAHAAEATLRGNAPDAGAFALAAEAELAAAKPLPDNVFKVELCRRVVTGALLAASEVAL